jgi:hypothetical protein
MDSMGVGSPGRRAGRPVGRKAAAARTGERGSTAQGPDARGQARGTREEEG